MPWPFGPIRPMHWPLPTLRLMDWLGNRGHDVALPYNYLSRSDWDAAFRRAGCKSKSWEERLALYPAPASLLFDRHLHFIALMAPDRYIAN